MIGGDVFVFPLVEDSVHQAGQATLAGLMMSSDVQVAFNEKKGSVPVLLNADVSGMDACAQDGMAMMQDESKQIPSDNYISSPDMVGARRDAITEFWNSPNMSVDTFVENYIVATESAL